MNTSRKHAFKNVPPPEGTKPASPYARFIPREELGEFASWQPGTLGNSAESFCNFLGQCCGIAVGPAVHINWFTDSHSDYRSWFALVLEDQPDRKDPHIPYRLVVARL